MQIGAKLEIVGSDGFTRVVFNDAEDPDFIGFLTNGTSGLDGTDIREAGVDLPGQDGGAHSDFFMSRRAIVLEAILPPAVDVAHTNEREHRLRRIMNTATRADLTMTWQEDGLPPQSISGRLGGRLIVQPGRPRKAQIPIVCADPRIYSSADTVIRGNWSSGSSMQVKCINIGSTDAPGVVRITGPASGITLEHQETGKQIVMSGASLSAGEYLDIDLLAHTVTKNGVTRAYHLVDFLDTNWFLLTAGSSSTLVVTATGLASGAQVQITYRSAWV